MVLIAGWLVHGAVGFIGLIFTAVWLLIAYLRAEVLRRQKRGLLPGQQSPPATRLSAVTERTLVLIKPDGVKRRLIGEILSRIEGKGLTVAALELKNVERRPCPPALCRTRGQAVLPVAAGVHHLGPRRRGHRGGPAGGCRVSPDRRRHRSG